MRDYETVAAWQTKWNGAVGLTAVPLNEKDKPEPRETVSANPNVSKSYAIILSEPAGGNLHSSTGEIDYRIVTVTIYAQSKKAVYDLMVRVDNAFSDNASTYPANALTFTSPTVWMRTERLPGGADKIEKTEENRTQEGQWWKGTMKWRVQTSRDLR